MTMLSWPIPQDELAELRLLQQKIPGMSKISFELILATPHLVGPLRRTLEAHKLALALRKAQAAREAADFHLTP